MYQDKERVKNVEISLRNPVSMSVMIAAGCADLCDDCYWHQIYGINLIKSESI